MQLIPPTWQAVLFVLRLVEMWGNERMHWDAGCALLVFIGILHTGSAGCRGFLLLFQAPTVLLLHFRSLSVETNDFHWHLVTFYLCILDLFHCALLYTFFKFAQSLLPVGKAACISLVTTGVAQHHPLANDAKCSCCSRMRRRRAWWIVSLLCVCGCTGAIQMWFAHAQNTGDARSHH